MFANRSNLRMGGVEWIGFDMDYTLAVYRQSSAWMRSSVELMAERMLIARGYPEFLQPARASTLAFPIRGLLVDSESGNILKMDRHKLVLQRLPRHSAPQSRQDLDHLYHTPQAYQARKPALPLDRYALRPLAR